MYHPWKRQKCRRRRISLLAHGQFRNLISGIRRKLAYSESVTEARFASLEIDDSITVREALTALYTLLTNYDYNINLELNTGLDPIEYMEKIGVYRNGEQQLKDRCSVEQAMVYASRIIGIIYEATGASSKGFLWEAKSGGNTVYLLGSIHLASTNIYPFSQTIWQAYNSSDALFVEANLFDKNDTNALYALMYYNDGTTLKEHVSAETYEKTIKAAALLGLPEISVRQLKPWALYLSFEGATVQNTSDDASMSAQLGIDYTFETNAIIYQKPLYALESLEQQGKMLDGFSEELQEYLLSSYSDAIIDIFQGTSQENAAELDNYMDAVFECWKTGDVAGYHELTTGEEEEDAFEGELSEEDKVLAEEYREKMFERRDDAMADYINTLLKADGNSSCFVVLGSSHFISDYSVIDRLRKMGYDINQLK